MIMKQDPLGAYTCASSWIKCESFDFIEFWLYTQDLASQLYQVAEYSRCQVYQVLHQVAEDLDTNKKTKQKKNTGQT